MSFFDSIVGTMNNVILSTFGDTVEVALADDVTLQIDGVFEGKRDDVEANVAPSYRYTLTVKTANLAGFTVVKRNTVTINSVVYTIVDILPDAGGMTTWVLKRYG